MLFNSIDFAIFFPVVFMLYWLVAKQLTLRNGLILVASYTFYGWWDWRFLFLIAISTIVDFIVGQKIYQAENKSQRKYFAQNFVTFLQIKSYKIWGSPKRHQPSICDLFRISWSNQKNSLWHIFKESWCFWYDSLSANRFLFLFFIPSAFGLFLYIVYL